MVSSPSPSSRRSEVLSAIAITIAVFLFYGTVVGFEGWLFRDQGLYLYTGQQIAEGRPPYTTAFDIKPPLSSLFVAVAVPAARWTGISDLTAARILFALAASSASAGIFLLVRRLLHELGPALIAALLPLILLPWVADVGMGPRPKVLATAFTAWAIYGVVSRNWGLAGLAIGLGALTYQPVGLAGASMMAGIASFRHRDRTRNLAVFGAGVAAPWVAMATYAVATGSASETFWSVLGVHITDLGERAQLNPVLGFFEFAAVLISQPLWLLLVPGLIGLFVATLEQRDEREPEDAVAWRTISLGAATLVVWFCVEFQVPADAYPILPFCALGVACILDPWLRPNDEEWAGRSKMKFGFLAGGLMLAAMIVGYRVQATEPGLSEQRTVVREIAAERPDGVSLMVVGAPAVLALAGWQNPTRFVLLDPGFGAFIDSRHPRGFRGWLAEELCAKGDFLVVGGRIPLFRDQASPWYEQFERSVRDNYRRIWSPGPWQEQDLSVWRRVNNALECSASLR